MQADGLFGQAECFPSKQLSFLLRRRGEKVELDVITLSPIDWNERVANPEALGEREKALWNKIDPILHSVLDEFKSNGLVETVFVQKESDSLKSCIQKVDDFSQVSNALLHISDSTEKAKDFVENNKKFGFSERIVVAGYIMSIIAVTVLKTELFKAVLLFHIKRSRSISHSVSQFVKTMERVAPRSWPKLKPFVDNPLRNALSHGTYALVGGKIVLYNDATLEPFEELGIGHLMMRMKDQDVLFQCLINVLQTKARTGFLTS